MHADCRQYTWSRMYESRLTLVRLDRFYCFKHHLNVFKSCNIFPVAFTDHSLVVCVFYVKDFTPKSAYWHFNSALTFDTGFKDVLGFFWTQFRLRKHDFSSLGQWWDRGKTEIKLLCQQYTLNVTRDYCRFIKDLEADIVGLESLSGSTGNRGHIELLKERRLTLERLLDSKVQGALVRSRFQDVSEMDAPSSFFFGLEKKQGQMKVMHSLLSDTGEELLEPDEIRQRAVDFYSSLYTSECDGDDSLLDEFCSGLPHVAEEMNSQLDRPLQLPELSAALQSMKGRKAPGIDGLTVEFYKAFWDILAPDILEVFNDCLLSGALPTSCRRAVVALLPKKGNLQEIKNWRPVSLLCVDYKILSRTFSNRLRDAMEQIIHRDQTYCVRGRLMVDNVFLIRDVLEVSELLGIRTGLISLDQEKAFDRVEHSFLWKVMEKFGFCAGFIAKIKVFYAEAESVLKVNGGLCAPFRVGRGIRQGCALSGMLYALSLEPLLHKIRKSIEGLCLPGFQRNIVLSAYADDVIVFVQNQADVNVLVDAIHAFSKLSSARVNWHKTAALAVGQWLDALPTLPSNVTWKKDGLKYLGVFLGGPVTVKKNWEDVVHKLEGKMNKWRWLLPQMSFRGRVLVINNLVASLLWHRLMCLDPPSGLLSQIQSKLVNFFWDSLHWVPQGVLFLPREEGGQGLVHLASRTATFRLQFLQRFLTGPTDLMWRELARCILRRANGLGLDDALFLMNTKFLDVRGLPPFYQGVFKSWHLFNVVKRKNSPSLFWLLKEPLIFGAWLDICDDTTPGLRLALRRSGVVTLEQLVAAAGPDLSDVSSLCSSLGLWSTRMARRLLDRWRDRLGAGVRELLVDYCSGTTALVHDELFPEVWLSPDLGGLTGQLLHPCNSKGLTLHCADRRTLYVNCVKVLNKTKLQNRLPSAWTGKLSGGEDVPHWRVLYKAPIRKRTGDLQWRILHGAVASNSFISVLNPTVSDCCPFCDMRETIFHVFSECKRLSGLFTLLTSVFALFNVTFSVRCFIYGSEYKQKDKEKWQLLNFIVGEAKLAIHVSRKREIAGEPQANAVSVWRCNVRSRLKLEFSFFRLSNRLSCFKKIWCFDNVLCRVSNGEICFAPFLFE
uniref:Reverse transcriptase domain-containing protein n=1 Tax=Oryzias latipes TaxID=8090 RepID=A0A3B3HMN0_ORYLA